MLNKLGEELREARLKSNVTLQQMASKTRIDIKFLEALENGNYTFLPELYVKAFLKEYSRFVGLDEYSVLKKYDMARQGKSFEEPPVPVENKPDQNELKEEIRPVTKTEEIKPEEIKQENVRKEEPPKPQIKKIEYKPATQPAAVPTFDSLPAEAPSDSNSSAFSRQRMLLAALVGGTIVVIALVYFLFFNNSSEIIVPEKPIDEVIESNEKFYEDESAPEPAPVTADTVIAAAGDSLRLEIRTTDTSWVQITFDDTRTDEFILFPGAKKNLSTRNNYKIIFGRAPAIKLALNGSQLNYAPGKVNVSRIMIDSSGITYLEVPQRVQQGR